MKNSPGLKSILKEDEIYNFFGGGRIRKDSFIEIFINPLKSNFKTTPQIRT